MYVDPLKIEKRDLMEIRSFFMNVTNLPLVVLNRG